MDKKHTPGPWRMWTSNSFRRISSDATGGDGDVLCAVRQSSDGHPDLHFKNGGFEGPDATLILAAPDMFAALRRAVCALAHAANRHAEYQVAYDVVDAAIRKATGEQE